MRNENALRGLLGLAQRAGRLQTGGDIAIAAVKTGKAVIALVDESASENTVKKISDACIYYHVPLYHLPEGLLEMSCGRSGRVVAALTDAGFAAKIQSILSEEE